jgi:adenylate kinase family enzyme
MPYKKQPQTIIFFGSSGSGKGTQAQLLMEYLQKNDSSREVLYIETGRRFREFIKEKNYTSTLTAEVLNEGGVVPEFMPIWIWTEYLIRHFSGSEHMVLDGLSRQPHEASILDSAIKFYKREHPIVMEIKVGRDWAIDKLLSRKRGDDTAESITTRLNWYYDKTAQAVEFFKQNPYYSFHTINGEQDVQAVHEEIIKALEW